MFFQNFNQDFDIHQTLQVLHYVKYRNFAKFPGVEILWNGTVSA